MDCGLEILKLPFQFPGHAGQVRGVERHTCALHARQHFDQGKLHRFAEGKESGCAETLPLQVHDTQREVRVLGGVVRQPLQRHSGDRLLVLPASHQLLE